MKIDCEPIQSGKNEIRLRSEMFPQNAKRAKHAITLIRNECVCVWRVNVRRIAVSNCNWI